MNQACPNCGSPSWRDGYFVRLNQRKRIQRFRCRNCGHCFSHATFQDEYRQKRRELNDLVRGLLCSKTSQNRISLVVGTNRKTVARKKSFLAMQARRRNRDRVLCANGGCDRVYLDGLITYEHTRCKPIAVAAVVTKGRQVLGIKASKIPAIGRHLAPYAHAKYGARVNERQEGLEQLLAEIAPAVSVSARWTMDQEPSYPDQVLRQFPCSRIETHPSKRASVAGQGELKTLAYVPLFPINHVFAMLRDNVASLVRRTWATAKSLKNLEDHLEIYVDFHNSVLT